MRTWRSTVAVLLVIALFAHRARRPSAAAARAGAPESTDQQYSVDEMSFIFDAAARFNERLLGTIDAIDTALTAILAGNVAVVVFTIDKIADLQPQKEIAAVALLGGSILACVMGYIFRFGPHDSNPDGVRPRFFMADLSARREETILGAIEELVAAGEINLTVRFVKRMLAICAIILLLAGVVVLGLARSSAMVVY